MNNTYRDIKNVGPDSDSGLADDPFLDGDGSEEDEPLVPEEEYDDEFSDEEESPSGGEEGI